jgi:hypothetical protein
MKNLLVVLALVFAITGNALASDDSFKNAPLPQLDKVRTYGAGTPCQIMLGLSGSVSATATDGSLTQFRVVSKLGVAGYHRRGQELISSAESAKLPSLIDSLCEGTPLLFPDKEDQERARLVLVSKK